MLYAGIFALFLKGAVYGGIINPTPFMDVTECESHLPAMRSLLFIQKGQYVVLSQGCKSMKDWIRIIGTDPRAGRDA